MAAGQRTGPHDCADTGAGSAITQPPQSGGTARLFIATGSFRASQNMAQTTLSLLGRALGFSGTGIGAVAAGANLVGVLTMVLITARLASGHAQRAIFAGLALMAAALAVFTIPTATALFLGALLLGLAGGLAMPSFATAAAGRSAAAQQARAGEDPGTSAAGRHSSRVQTARALAQLSVVLSISLTLGPLYESLVLSAAGQRLRIAYLAFLPVVLIGLLAVRGREPAAAGGERRTTLRSSLTGLGALFANRRWALAMCAQAIYAVPFTVVVVFAGLLGHTRYHISASTTEVAVALFFVISFLCRGTLARWPAVGHRMPLFGICVLATLCGIALLAASSGLGAFMIALAILGAPHGLTYPLALGLVAESVPTEGLSQANAGFNAVGSLISVIAPLVLGLVIDDFGDRDMLLCAAVPVVLLAGLLWRLRDAA